MNDLSFAQTLNDTGTAEAFQDTVATMLNHGALCIMLSIGHRSHLLDRLAELPPSTSHEIAEAANLDERFVREWLAAMVTGGMVAYDSRSRTYQLPADYAASLTRDGRLGNLAVYAQAVALFGKVEDRLLESLRNGKGLAYDDYPCFHQIMAEDSQQTVVDGIGETFEALAPDLVERLDAGIDVLDAGCGAGRAAIRLAELFPHSRFAGFDLCADAIAMARDEAARRGLGNVSFDVFDLSRFDETEAFDLVTSFDAVHDMKHPQVLLTAIHQALRPGGIHVMQDIGGSAHLENNLNFPFAPFLYAISFSHCTPVSLAQGGEGLGTMWGWETAQAMLKNAGFANSTRQVFPHDPMNVWFVSRKVNNHDR